MLGMYVGGVAIEHVVSCLNAWLQVAPKVTSYPGQTFWAWAFPEGRVWTSDVEIDGGYFEVGAQGTVWGRTGETWSDLAFAQRFLEHCPEACVLVDDPDHCETYSMEFLRVTAERIELVVLVEDEETEEEYIDESLTRLIARR